MGQLSRRIVITYRWNDYSELFLLDSSAPRAFRKVFWSMEIGQPLAAQSPYSTTNEPPQVAGEPEE